jgi:hypothetical protein
MKSGCIAHQRPKDTIKEVSILDIYPSHQRGLQDSVTLFSKDGDSTSGLAAPYHIAFENRQPCEDSRVTDWLNARNFRMIELQKYIAQSPTGSHH